MEKRRDPIMKKWFLACTDCGRSYPVERVYPRCDACGEPLQAGFPGPGCIREGNPLDQRILERYGDFFPFAAPDRNLSLGEGFTPLVRARKVSGTPGLTDLYFKNETMNPTWSFKDRGTIAGIQHAIQSGYETIGTLSSGNMAVSVAAYGARAGLKTVVLVSAAIPPEKIAPIAIHSPILVKVDGDYGEIYFESLRIGKKKGIYFINSDVPFRVEGSKTIAFEICEQLRFDGPDWVVVPTSAGGNLRGIIKGFEEFQRAGLIGKMPRFVSVQARGCAPIYRAFAEGSERVTPVAHPETLAHAIENPCPPSGNEILRKIRGNGGKVVAVTDEEMIFAQGELAREGIFAQPEGAASLAAVKNLMEEKQILPGDRVVCIVTGGGLKYGAAFEYYRFEVVNCSISSLETCLSSVL